MTAMSETCRQRGIHKKSDQPGLSSEECHCLYERRQVGRGPQQGAQAGGEASGNSSHLATSQDAGANLLIVAQWQLRVPDGSRADTSPDGSHVAALRAALGNLDEVYQRLVVLRAEEEGSADEAEGTSLQESLHCLLGDIKCMEKWAAEPLNMENIDDAYADWNDWFQPLDECFAAEQAGWGLEEIDLRACLEKSMGLNTAIFARILPLLEISVKDLEGKLERMQLRRLSLEGRLKALGVQRNRCSEFDKELKKLGKKADEDASHLKAHKDFMELGKARHEHLLVRPTCSVEPAPVLTFSALPQDPVGRFLAVASGSWSFFPSSHQPVLVPLLFLMCDCFNLAQTLL